MMDLFYCLIKLLPFTFLELFQARKSFPYICLIHLYMSYVVAGSLGCMSVPTLRVVFL